MAKGTDLDDSGVASLYSQVYGGGRSDRDSRQRKSRWEASVIFPSSLRVVSIVKEKFSDSCHHRYAILVSLTGGQRHGRFARARQRVDVRHRRESEYAIVWAR